MVDVVVQPPNDPKSRVYKSGLTQAQVDALALDFTVYTVTAGVVSSTGVGPTRALAVAKPDLFGAEGNYDFINYPGSPVGNVTPARVGQRCQDTTTGLFYVAQTLSVNGWARTTGITPLSRMQPRQVPMHSAQIDEPLLQLTLPSPYYTAGISSTREHAYGTPLFFPQGFGGYRYWMLGAPYPTQGGTPKAAAKYENPTVYVSNDGESWSVPAGLDSWTTVDGSTWTKEAAASYPGVLFTSLNMTVDGGNSYFADPYLALSADGTTLWAFWHWFSRTGTTKSSILCSSSTNGVNWSSPQTISAFDSTSTTFTPNSVSIFQNGGGGWTACAIDTRDGTGTYTPIYSTTTSSSPLTGWAAPGAVFSGVWTSMTMTHPLSRSWWHMHIVPLQGTTAANTMLIGGAADNTAAGGCAFTLMSPDGGATWSVQPFSGWNTASAGGTWYRPSLCLCNDGVTQRVQAYISRITPAQNAGFYVHKANLKFDYGQDAIGRATLRDTVHRQVAAPVALKAGGLIAWDSFNRTDSAATMGTADSGHAWTTATGTMGISTNRAYNASTSNSIATIDLACANFDLECQIQTPGTNWNLVFSFADSSNFWRLNYSGPGIQKIVGGSVAATYAPQALTFSAGDILRVVRVGRYITLFYNDRIIDTIDDSAMAGNTKVGLQASGASATYFDNFIVRQV